jgi:hypothetical protein
MPGMKLLGKQIKQADEDSGSSFACFFLFCESGLLEMGLLFSSLVAEWQR